jgi:hypothetical protein
MESKVNGAREEQGTTLQLFNVTENSLGPEHKDPLLKSRSGAPHAPTGYEPRLFDLLSVLSFI